MGDPGALAGVRTQATVHDLAVDLYGEAVVLQRTLAGLGGTVSDVAPLAGVAAARHVRDQAGARMRKYAVLARGEGSSWAELAQWLGVIEQEQGEWVRAPGSPAQVAFEFVAAGSCPAGAAQWHWNWANPAVVRWTCGCCGCPISDRGPGEPDPRQGEQGHAVDCARWGKAVAAYDRERDGAGEFTDV